MIKEMFEVLDLIFHAPFREGLFKTYEPGKTFAFASICDA